MAQQLKAPAAPGKTSRPLPHQQIEITNGRTRSVLGHCPMLDYGVGPEELALQLLRLLLGAPQEPGTIPQILLLHAGTLVASATVKSDACTASPPLISTLHRVLACRRGQCKASVFSPRIRVCP